MFSSTIKIASVSDYITPSQECVKPLMRNAKLQLDDPTILSKPDLIKNMGNIAKVSLQDCLACSGCITTAETLLIESHSKEEFLANVAKAKSPAIGLSPQSRSSLAFKFQVTDAQMHDWLQQYFSQWNVILYDLAEYSQQVIQMCQAEFLTNLKKQNASVPLLSSECPGWVCYAEKTLDETIINHMSRVKSPQQLFGKIKRIQHDYIATIMPCYDKKLEAVRLENQEEINIVLSTKEIEEMLEHSQKPKLLNEITLFHNQIQKEYGNPSSNGYLDWIIECFMEHNNIQNGEIVAKQRRNSDFIEIQLIQGDQIIGQFARIFGLKNIANLIQQLKSKSCKYLYVEIMACPMGCLNGGGQVKQGNLKSNELIPKLKQLMIADKQNLLQTQKEIIQIEYTSFKHIPKEDQNIQW